MREEFGEKIDLTGMTTAEIKQDPFKGPLKQGEQLITSALVGFFQKAFGFSIECLLKDKGKQSYKMFPFLFNRSRVQTSINSGEASMKAFKKRVFNYLVRAVEKTEISMRSLAQRVKTEPKEDSVEGANIVVKRKVWLGFH
jgi:hypothetical protein